MLYLKNTYEEEIVEIPSQLQESFSLSDEYETSTYLDSLCDVFILYDKKQNKHFNLVAYDEINKRRLVIISIRIVAGTTGVVTAIVF